MSQYSFVGQNDAGSSTSTTSQAVVYTPTANNFLIMVAYSHLANTVTITDSRSNTWTPFANAGLASDNYFVYAFFAPNCKGGLTTFTANYQNATTFPNVYIEEFSGVANISNPLVGSGSNFVLHPGVVANAIGSSAALPTQVPCLLWGFCGSGQVTAPPLPGSSFTGQTPVWANAATPEDALDVLSISQNASFTASALGNNGNADYAVLMGQFVLTPLLLGQACL